MPGHGENNGSHGFGGECVERTWQLKSLGRKASKASLSLSQSRPFFVKSPSRLVMLPVEMFPAVESAEGLDVVLHEECWL